MKAPRPVGLMQEDPVPADEDEPAPTNNAQPHGKQPACTGAPGEKPGFNCRKADAHRAPKPIVSALYEKQTDIPLCNGTNGVPGEDCETPNQRRERKAREASAALVQTDSGYYLPTCTDRTAVDCQPTCTESLTRGCTEARTPNWPERDRFEGKYTHK